MAQTALLELKVRGILDAEANVAKLNAQIADLRVEQKNATAVFKAAEKQYKNGEISTAAYTQAMDQFQTTMTDTKSEMQALNKDLRQNKKLQDANTNSLDEQKAELALLTAAYNKLDQGTAQGAATAKQLQGNISALTEGIKEQEKSLGNNTRNVGNYEDSVKDAVRSMIPFGDQLTEIASSNKGVKGTLTALRTGIISATKAAMAFIATPIGAAIAALAAIGTATKAFIDYNAEVEKTNALISGLTNTSGDLVDQIRIQSGAISNALDLDQERLVQSAKVLVQQFGLSYDEALSQLQSGLLATNGANEEFLDSISEYSTFFSDAGFSVEEFANIVNAGFDVGIYKDKLPDALKEANISLKEQTKATRDALENAFGPEFTQTVLDQVNTGAITTKQALEMIAEQSEKVVQKNGEIGLSSEQAATITADVFRGAGEDAGGALKVFEAINVSLEEQTSQLDEQGKRLEQDIERQQEVAEARDRALNSEAVQSFMKVLKDLAAFFTKVFFGTIELFATIVDTKIIKPINFVIDGFNKLKDAASSALSPLKSITDALGVTSDKTDSAAKSTSNFIDKINEQKQAQAKANTETEKAAIVLDEARERAEGYVEALQDIVKEQQRQPILLQAEDIFSERTAETITQNLQNVSDQIEANANLTSVNVEGITVSVEEYAQLAQNALNNLQKAEDDAEKASQKRSADRRRENEKTAAEEAKQALERLNTLYDIIQTEKERKMSAEDLLATQRDQLLSENDLLRDVSELTETELAARNAIYDKYYADLDKLEKEQAQTIKDNATKELSELQKLLTNKAQLELLALEEREILELAAFEGTEFQKMQILAKFQKERLRLEKQAVQEQMIAIAKQLNSEDLTDLFTPEQINDMQVQLAKLNNEILKIDGSIEQVSTDAEGAPRTITDALGISEEKIETAMNTLATMSQGLDVVSEAIQARQLQRLNEVEQKLEQGVITEEQAAARKEKIQKEFGKKQKRNDIIQGLINTALAVTAALGSKPFTPANFVMAALAGAQGLAQVAMMKKQKFSKGGLLAGPSHAQGGIPMFSKGGAFYGEAEGGEAVLTKGVMKNPALASMASAINVAGGGVPLFQGGGIIEPISAATPTERAADIISAATAAQRPVLVVEQLRERERSLDVIENLRTIG